MSTVKFVSVDRPSAALDGVAGNGNLNIIRSGNRIELRAGQEATKTALGKGLVVEGNYIGSTANKFNPEKSDYMVREEDGTLTILNGTASLDRQFSKVGAGELIQVMYKGKRNITRKNGATAAMHDFEVLRALVEAEAGA